MSKEAPYYWVEQIERAARLTQEVPLWGTPPAFPWEECKKALSKSWNLPDLSFTPYKTLWRTHDQLLEGLGNHPEITAFELSPLKGAALLAISSEDVSRLTRAALVPHGETKGFSDKQLQDGFYKYLLLEGLYSIEQLKPFEDLSVTLAGNHPLPESGALCIDIQGEVQGKPIWARILLGKELCKSFQTHFIQKPHAFSHELIKSLELTLKIEVGTTSLPLSKWKAIKPGDFLLLDRCTFDPKTHKGSAELVLDQTPLFHVRLKEEGIKILDYAFYYEEEMTTMDEEDDIEDDEDEDFDEDEDEDFDEDDEDEDEDQDEDDEDDEEEEEVTFDDSAQKEEPPAKEEQPLWEKPSSDEKKGLGKKITASTIPLTMTVEVARLKLTVEKLLELQPGNELTLPVHPEQGVDLLINGKKVAKGELIKIGEALGIRILHIGG
ncbi:MAG: type III secretion system cytoplasmic ring protein SctQ [Chlamydiota bacterium]